MKIRNLVPRFSIVIVFVALLTATVLSTSGCLGAQVPPAGTYSPQGMKANDSVQWLKDLTALSDTAKNLNATTGKLHLKDIDTRYVLDFCLSAGSAVQTYGTQGSNLAVVSRGFNALVQSLSVEAKQNGTLAKSLAVVAAFVNNLPQ